MHAAIVVGRLLPGRRRRHRQKREIAEAREAVAAVTAGLASMMPSPKAPSAPTAPTPPATSPPPSGRRYLVAMFTDLSGSTATNERLGDEVWAELVADHRRVVRASTAAHSGTEVSTQGDGFFVRFDQPTDATACAVDIQERFKVERGNGSAVPPVRIGIHLGDAVHEDDDVLGRVVNVAARLLEVARPDEILVTEPVADVVDAPQLDDRGLVTLKGMAQPRHVLAIRRDPETSGEPARPASRSSRGTGRRRGRSYRRRR